MATPKPQKPAPSEGTRGGVPMSRPPDPATTASKPRRTFVEQQLVDDLGRLFGKPLTEQEANLAIAQAWAVGEL